MANASVFAPLLATSLLNSFSPTWSLRVSRKCAAAKEIEFSPNGKGDEPPLMYA